MAAGITGTTNDSSLYAVMTDESVVKGLAQLAAGLEKRDARLTSITVTLKKRRPKGAELSIMGVPVEVEYEYVKNSD